MLQLFKQINLQASKYTIYFTLSPPKAENRKTSIVLMALGMIHLSGQDIYSIEYRSTIHCITTSMDIYCMLPVY
jgi:hypothetical protein